MGVLRHKTGIILCAVLLAMVIGTGSAWAYFSDYEMAKGGVTYNMGYETTVEEQVDKLTKDISIRNKLPDGESEGADVVVRVKIFGPDEYLQVSPQAGTWTAGSDGWYYYNGVLAPGQATPAGTLKAAIAAEDGTDLDAKIIAQLGDSFQITVVHESAIATYTQSNGRNVVKSPDGWDLPTIAAE